MKEINKIIRIINNHKSFKEKIIRKWISIYDRLRGGLKMDSFITLRCQYKCRYCFTVLNGNKFSCKEKSLDEWKNYINNDVPYKIKGMAVIGGEPGLISWVSDYVNFLLDKKIRVTLFTNLYYITNFMNIKKSHLLTFYITYHEEYADYNRFITNLKIILDKGFSVHFSYVAKQVDVVTGNFLMTIQDLEKQKPEFRIAPDLTIHPRCWDIGQYFKIH